MPKLPMRSSRCAIDGVVVLAGALMVVIACAESWGGSAHASMNMSCIGPQVPTPGTPGTACGPAGSGCVWQPRARVSPQSHPCKVGAITTCSPPAGAGAPCGFCFGPCTVSGVWYQSVQEGQPTVCAHPKEYVDCKDFYLEGVGMWTSRRRYICNEPLPPSTSCGCQTEIHDSSPACGPTLEVPLFRGC